MLGYLKGIVYVKNQDNFLVNLRINSYATISREVQNTFVLRVVSLVSEFKKLI
jgi:hypothetical protein